MKTKMSSSHDRIKKLMDSLESKNEHIDNAHLKGENGAEKKSHNIEDVHTSKDMLSEQGENEPEGSEEPDVEGSSDDSENMGMAEHDGAFKPKSGLGHGLMHIIIKMAGKGK